MSAPNAFSREWSNPVVTRNADGTVSISWADKGYNNCTIVADELIDQWMADKNRLVALEAALSWVHAYLGSEADWDEIDDGYEAEWYRTTGQLLHPASESEIM